MSCYCSCHEPLIGSFDNVLMLFSLQLELSTIRKQLLEEFSADDICSLGETHSKYQSQNGKLPQKSMEVVNLVSDI